MAIRNFNLPLDNFETSLNKHLIIKTYNYLSLKNYLKAEISEKVTPPTNTTKIISHLGIFKTEMPSSIASSSPNIKLS